MLKDKVYVPVGAAVVDFQRQRGQGGGMPVVAAFVADSRGFGAVGGIDVVLYGQGVEIGPEGYWWGLIRGLIRAKDRGGRAVTGIEPAALVDYLQSGMGFKKPLQVGPGPFLLH